jgi:drug/metabolite transporter (DMT)-like permease
MDFVKKVALLVVGGVVLLGVIAGAAAWFSADPADRSAAIGSAGRVAGAFGIALLLPWLTFFASTAAGRAERNWVGAALVAAYTAVDAGLLGWAMRFSTASTTVIVLGVFSVVVLATYNLLACDWLAERAGT